MSAPNGSLPAEDTYTAFTELMEIFPNYNVGKIKTAELLEGSRGVVNIIDRFGKVFAAVVFDMNRNIEKINTKFETNDRAFEYIEDFILLESQMGDSVVIDALQWLRRALHFVSRLFHHILDNHDNGLNDNNLTPLLKRAYSETLEQYHGWLGTQMFSVMSRFAPPLRELFVTLALNKQNSDDSVVRDMRVLTEKIGGCVEKLRKFYEDHNLETFYTA